MFRILDANEKNERILCREMLSPSIFLCENKVNINNFMPRNIEPDHALHYILKPKVSIPRIKKSRARAARSAGYQILHPDSCIWRLGVS